ncbi:MAG: MASE1 domain-containing protein [Trebonia sp.]
MVAAAHAAGTVVVYQFNHLTSAGELFFPAAGVTVAVLLLVPRRWWPVVLSATFAAELAADLILREFAVTAIGSALANTAGPALGASLVLRVAGGCPQLSRRHDLAAFVLGAAVAGPALGALIGAIATRFTHPYGPFHIVFARWWTGDALGVLIVGSVILAWLTRDVRAIRPRYAPFEGSLVAVLTCLVTWLVFWRWRPALAYLALVPLGWAAIRFGTRGAAVAGAVIAVLAEWATGTGHGLFAVISRSHDEALWYLQLFLAVALLGGLMMAAAVAEVSRAEAALRASETAERDARLAAQQAHADERTRLARELHDSVSQALFSMTMHASTAQLAMEKAQIEEDSPASRAVSRLRALTAGALAEMRALIFELRPGALAEEGLVSALRRQAAAISAREEVQITVNGPAERLPLDPAAEEHCYRLVLEAWHNTVKHVGATASTTTTITSDGAAVTVRATDDGRGFDSAAVPPGHLGLQTMRERAAAIGATLDVISTPGQGTSIVLRVPASTTLPEPAAPPVAGPEGGLPP